MELSYQVIPAPAVLASCVRFFWVLEAKLSASESYIHRSMADGGAEMIFHFKGRFDDIKGDLISGNSFISGISGPAKVYSRFHIAESFGIFGAYLYPFAISRLFSIPATELCNQMPDMKTLLGQEGQDIEERMLIALTNKDRVQILTDFLLMKLKKNGHQSIQMFEAIQQIIMEKGVINIKNLSSHYSLSPRQFERNFKAQAGFSPKLYSRIIRFQSALQAYGQNYRNLTDLAYECGYYDQSHFIHDFKEFSGFHPGRYFSGNAEGTEWREA